MYFSCIVTCYNREGLIERAIHSILNQSFQNFEIIIVDDGSTDKSVERINAIKDNRIQLIVHQKNCGQNAAINTGISASNYSHLAFLDSDDTWNSDYLFEMDKAYAENPSIKFAYCNLTNGPLSTIEGENKYGDVLNQGYLSSMITITAKKDAVLAAGGFDLKYRICQDDDFCFRMAKNFPFKAIAKKLANVHGASNSMTRDSVAVAKGWAFIFKNYKADIEFYCGAKSYSRHMLNVSQQFFNSKKIVQGGYYYLLSCYYFIKISDNRYKFTFKDFKKSTFQIINMMFAKLKKYL